MGAGDGLDFIKPLILNQLFDLEVIIASFTLFLECVKKIVQDHDFLKELNKMIHEQHS